MAQDIEERRGGVPIANIVAQRIDREPIRVDFYTQMEGPTQDTCDLAFDLFDRWGCIKDDFLRHPIKKGTGVWGEELNQGEMLLFEFISVDRDFRRQGVGKKLVQDLWANVWPEPTKAKEGFEFAGSEEKPYEFAIVWPTYLNNGDLEQHDLSPEALEVYAETSEAEAVSFWRSLGFRRIGTSRWFALAANPAHPSHKLSAQADYNPPQKNSTQDALHDSIQTIVSRKPPKPQGFDITNEFFHFQISIDDSLVTLMQSHLHTHGATHPSWLSVDKNGDTVGHLGTKWPKLLEWLLNQPLYSANSLFSIRNHQGETPADTYESLLKELRVSRKIMNYTEHVSDGFRGYDDEGTNTLLLLLGINPTTCAPEERERVKWGCTCGDCISYLSPHVRHALALEAESFYECLLPDFSSDLKEWIEVASEFFPNLSPAMVKKLRMKEHDLLRDGVRDMFRYVYRVLTEKKQIPTLTNVYRLIKESPETAQRSVMEFFSQRGKLSSIVLTCFEAAIKASRYLGDGEHESYGGERDTLPKCRNDYEFVMAREAYIQNRNVKTYGLLFGGSN